MRAILQQAPRKSLLTPHNLERPSFSELLHMTAFIGELILVAVHHGDANQDEP